jgi:hypothetical protein
VCAILDSERGVAQRRFFNPSLASDTIVSDSIDVLALFSDDPMGRLRSSLRAEAQTIHSYFPHAKHMVLPAARIPQDLDTNLRRYSPRILQFSCHADAGVTEGGVGSLYFYSEGDHRRTLLRAADLRSSLMRWGASRLVCLFLNGCETEAIAVELMSSTEFREKFECLRVVCWRTIVDALAANRWRSALALALLCFALLCLGLVCSALYCILPKRHRRLHFCRFTRDFYSAVSDGKSVEMAFTAGVAGMVDGGLELGDPQLCSMVHKNRTVCIPNR